MHCSLRKNRYYHIFVCDGIKNSAADYNSTPTAVGVVVVAAAAAVLDKFKKWITF